jgi:Zc3h12a-like Ribonuclease NYN domain
MVFLLLVFAASLVGVFAAFLVPGWSDYLLISAPCAIASLLLLLRRVSARPKRARQGAEKWVIIDGSNIMHWKDGTPQIETVHAVLLVLKERGYTPGVVFDANAGYLLSGHYRHDGSFGKALGLPRDRVMVVPKGTPADPYILTAARDLGAAIVTNDKFRDWASQYPEIQQQGYLIEGGFRSGEVWLNLLAESGAGGSDVTAIGATA